MNGRLTLMVAWPMLIGFDTASQLALKIGSGALVDTGGLAWFAAVLSSPWIICGIAGYLGSFAAWMLILRRTDLSLAFPMTALAYVSVLVASQVLLGETVDLLRWAGVACIVGGFLFMIGDRTA